MMGESVGGEENTSQKREEIQRVTLRKQDRKKEVLGLKKKKKKITKTEEENTFN